jgi:superfamily II DNA helicase RecQ
LRTAAVSGDERDKQVAEGILQGNYQLVFFTPEALIQSKTWRRMLSSDVYTLNLRALVVDEAHTVKMW